MTTIYPAGQCEPAVHIPIAKTMRECLLEKLLRETLPDLHYVENGTKTSAERRNLIKQITHVVGVSDA
jgi:hypothetical protein